MNIKYGKDKNGGSRDILVDDVVVVREVLSSEAVELIEKIGQAVDAAITDTARRERTAVLEELRWWLNRRIELTKRNSNLEAELAYREVLAELDGMGR